MINNFLSNEENESYDSFFFGLVKKTPTIFENLDYIISKIDNKIKIVSVVKRDNRKVPFMLEKISDSIYKAAEKVGGNDKNTSKILADAVVYHLENILKINEPTVEEIQDSVEKILIENGHAKTAKEFIIYRNERTRARQIKADLTKKLLGIYHGSDEEHKENANINADTAMGTMLKFGSVSAKEMYLSMMPKEFSYNHKNGDIHIHDLDFYPMTTTCCQIDAKKLFKNGFSTGHGHVRESNDVLTYAALVCIIIQSNQNDQHGGQSIPNFDFVMADGVRKTHRKIYLKNLSKALELFSSINNDINLKDFDEIAKEILINTEQQTKEVLKLDKSEEFINALKENISNVFNSKFSEKIIKFCKKHSEHELKKAVYQAMQALIHNLNTMHSRAGAQVPFSSINYGTDVSKEGQLATESILLALESGLGNGETPIFPIHIFKVKDGISGKTDDPNYYLFKLACRVSAKRLFPNFSFIDAPFNLKYYKGTPETEVAYMGCRTRVLGNVCGKEITFGRGNLSFTTVNLPRIGIEADRNLGKFFEILENKVKICVEQLYDRYLLQGSKKVKNFPFLMGQGIWIDSEKLSSNDNLKEVLKNGTLSVGFIGLAECLKVLTGSHHGQSEESQKLGISIISKMRKWLDDYSIKYKMNYSLIATPAEGLSGRFVKIDREKYGVQEGVTDREYYTNSFHVPVYYKINPFLKIRLEAPYHELTNAGHITYVEVDGDIGKNLDAFEEIIQYMKQNNIGYGSINHPVDRDPVCGYTGIINEVCPKCGRVESDKKFERVRRITGYLVGTLERFNPAKKSEVFDRVKHIEFSNSESDDV